MRSRTQAAGGPGSPPEATLFRQAQAGCRDSLNRLRARHDGLVQAVVRRSGFGQLAFTEAVPLGRIGLWRAVLHYTPESGLAFSTYAGRCMRNEILHVTRAGAGRKAWPVLSDRMLDSLVEQETQWIRQSLLQLVARLPERLRYVIPADYGLDGQPASTDAAIGLQRGRTQQRVCQRHTEARV